MIAHEVDVILDGSWCWYCWECARMVCGFHSDCDADTAAAEVHAA